MRNGKTVTLRAFVKNKDGSYSLRDMSGMNIREYGKRLQKAIVEAKKFRDKYSDLPELEEVFDAIDTL